MTQPAKLEKPFDLAIAGELNLDLILYGLPLVMETERDLLGTAFISTLGSSSAIVAHNAAVLGLKVRFASLVGDDDFGRISRDRLQQAGVETADVVVDPAITTGVSILLPHGAERHALSYLGSISALTVAHLDFERLAQARHFHLSSLYLQTGLHPGLPEFLLQLKRAGLTISLDTNDDPANTWGSPLQQILPLVDIFMPSEGEICRMTGQSELAEAFRVIDDKVPTIVVKRGPKGCTVKHLDQIIDVPGVPVNPVDTIGAGDSFNAGFLCGYLKGKDLATCARAGNIAGSLSTLAAGGTESYRNRSLCEAFLREHAFPVTNDQVAQRKSR
ncbi:MAG TPA: carbohydrate kinase family protein [Terriglobales bacterium]|nr:carbohydrate kinase family protein [Terriglobales bacterium]